MALFQCFSFRWIKNLRMKTQVFLFQVLMVSLFGLLFGALLRINYKIMESVIDEISNQFLQKIHLQALHTESNNIKLQSLRNFQNNILELDKINQLNHLAQNLQDLEFPGQQENQCPPYSEVNVTKEYPYINIPIYCYAFFNSTHPWMIPEDAQTKQLFLFFNLLNSQIFRLGKNQKELSQISHKSDLQFFAMNPYAYYIQSYRPHSRPWYQSHINFIQNVTTKSEMYKISDCYENYVTGELQITATTSLTGLDGEFQGVLAVDILLKEILQLQTSNVDSLFLDINGRVIQSNTKLNFPDIEFANTTYFIYDKVYTGFDEDDWLQIQKEGLQKSSGKSSCAYNLSAFCRNNNFYNQDLIIKVFPILKKFYIIIFVDAQFLKKNELLTLEMETKFLNQIVTYGVIFVIVSCVLIFLTWVLLSLFLHPYNQLTSMTLESIKQNECSNSYNKPIKEVYRRIGLQNFESNIFRMKQTRSIECQNIQKFKYPKQTLEITQELREKLALILDVQYVFNQNSNIKNCSHLQMSEKMYNSSTLKGDKENNLQNVQEIFTWRQVIQ